MNLIKLSGLSASIVLSLSIFQQPTNAQRASTFATSCTDISINGAQLSATCEKKMALINALPLPFKGFIIKMDNWYKAILGKQVRSTELAQTSVLMDLKFLPIAAHLAVIIGILLSHYWELIITMAS